jgi:hypothetical protein
VDVPLSAKSGEHDKRYRVADPYLRFFLAFLNRRLPLVERGRGDLVLLAIERSWHSWRGLAIEPVIHDALLRLSPDLGFPEVAKVGGWWNRRHTPQIDIVAKSEDRGGGIAFAGSVKWREGKPFGLREYAELVRDVHSVPGVTDETKLFAVTRTGHASTQVAIECLGPADLLAAWGGHPGQ